MTALDWTLAGNTIQTWLLATGVALLTYGVLRVIRKLLLRQMGPLAKRTRNVVDDVLSDVLRSTRFFFVSYVSLYLGTRVLALQAATENVLRLIAVAVIVLQAALWGEVIIRAFIARRIAVALEEDAASATTLNALGFVSRLLMWVVLLLLGLANLGIEIGPLLAGLGVGGVAVALALQNILGDLFASLSIVLDQPFVVGDFIVIGDMAGTVERVGVKTTRIRSLSGEQLIFSNGDLLGSRIRNYKRMVERRALFSIGVTYQTSPDQLAAIPSLIRSIVEGQQDTRFERCHFQGFGDSSLDIETVYHVLDADYGRYMDIQQAINLEIYRQFAAAGIDFAYPTRTLIVERAATEVELAASS